MGFRRDDPGWSKFVTTVRNSGRAPVTHDAFYVKQKTIGTTLWTSIRTNITSNSAGIGDVLLELPAPVAQNALTAGVMAIYDSSLTTVHSGIAILVAGTPSFVYCIRDQSPSAQAVNVALGIGDWVMCSICCELA